MTIEDFEAYLRAGLFQCESAAGKGTDFIIIKGVLVTAGSRAGTTYDVGIIRAPGNPWVPHSSVHVRPHIVPMGQKNSQASALGDEWQYLSRRFDKLPTPRNFLTHILTVLGEV